MFGGVLFPNTSGKLVSLRFLHHLEWLDDLSDYSWGAAVLGYLYRQMFRASMGTQRDIAGFLQMLQVWAWERFLQLQPPLPPFAPDAPPPPFLPLARRWVDRRGYGREYKARHNLPYCRDLLDLLEGTSFGGHTTTR
nr:protein MAIN-LIKE 1-like [Nicotiana tomentosiformis]